jgi:hypothetical protein
MSLAAETMRGAEGLAAHNYYGRLSQVLGVEDPSARKKLQRDYRACADGLWQALNLWLEVWEGERGLPTAQAVSHRYIGSPISQALVRANDREGLREIFALAGLSPGSSVSPYEMSDLLDAWFVRDPSPVSSALRSLWQRDPSARERIATLETSELQAWDGRGGSESARPTRASLYVTFNGTCADFRFSPAASHNDRRGWAPDVLLVEWREARHGDQAVDPQGNLARCP